MQIPPIIERLLLSNEATLEMKSIGFSNLAYLTIPDGKTAVLLELEIQPFANIDPAGMPPGTNLIQFFTNLQTNPLTQNDWGSVGSSVSNRTNYQLKLSSSKINQQITIVGDFEFQPEQYRLTNNTATFFTALIPKFRAIRHETFLLIDEPIYLDIIFANNGRDASRYDGDVFNNNFKPKDNPPGPTPDTSYKSIDQINPTNLNTPVTNYGYFPQGKGQTVTAAATPPSDGIRWSQAGKESGLYMPENALNSGAPFTNAILYPGFWKFFPVVNVKYALINKKTSTYGLFGSSQLNNLK